MGQRVLVTGGNVAANTLADGRQDARSSGLIVCREHKRVLAEYALCLLHKPPGELRGAYRA